MRILLFNILLSFSTLAGLGQAPAELHPPLKIPMFLSGNFGEMRSDHFHSGIDIKTQGSIGKAVYAIREGHVSRIKVQANGYGKSIYLAHPDGTTSVYGHLDSYRDDIAAYVKKVQYQRKSHQVDIYLKGDEFRLERGEQIARSGNTGGSFGPHLHFEIRTTGNQHPTNVLHYGLDIKDHTAPRFLSMSLTPLSPGSRINGKETAQEFSLLKDQGIYTVPWGTDLKASGGLGMAVEVYDYLDGSGNRCGVYSLELYQEEKLLYKHVMDEFAFSESRYINAHMDYGRYIRSGVRSHRLHVLPHNKLRIYKELENRGMIKVPGEGTLPLRVVATDVAGNRSELQIELQSQRPASPLHVPQAGTSMSEHADNHFDSPNLRMHIPAGSLYEPTQFRLDSLTSEPGILSPLYQVHLAEVPLHKRSTLSIRYRGPEGLPKGKLHLLEWDAEDDRWVSAGGSYVEGWVSASVRRFGTYAIGLDTIAPEITPLNGSSKADQRQEKALRFRILDTGSGIEKYEGYIDNRWALFEYDPKNDLLTYTFDEERLAKNSPHELELYVSDEMGNVNLYHSTFTW